MLTKRPEGRSIQIVPTPRSLFSPRARFWIETFALVSVIAFVFALVIATLVVIAGAAAEEPESGQSRPSSADRTYEGMITDSHCGAKHSAAIGRTATDCTLICVHQGEQFVVVDGDTTYLLEGDAIALKRLAGRPVRIVGTLIGRTISVTSVVAA